MTSELTFDIEFHGPFRVGTGTGRDGLDAVADLDDPIPASHLKGLMRHATRDTLHLPDTNPLPHTVFGGQAHAGDSPWSWDSAHPATGTWHDAITTTRAVVVDTRVQITIDDTTGTAAPDHFLAGQQLWPRPDFRAQFTVSRSGWLPEADRPVHEALLRLAARAVTALGSQRRRGLGWVTIRPTGDTPELLDADLTTFHAVRTSA